jgi:hypothetical protein
MKKNIINSQWGGLLCGGALLCVAGFWGVPGLVPAGYAEDPERFPEPTPAASVTPAPGRPQEAIVKQDGVVYFLKEGRWHKVERELRLSEGVTVQSDGEVILKDGAKVTLKDGQLITLDGRIMVAPPGILGTAPSPEPSPR